MRSRVLCAFPLVLAAATLVACGADRTLEPIGDPAAPAMARNALGGATAFATAVTLPSLVKGVSAEAYAVDQAGSIVAGYSWDRAGRMNPVKWTPSGGSWQIAALPYAASATSAVARGVNDFGDVAGNDFPASAPHVVLWPASGGFTTLGCSDLGEGYAISASGQVVVGVDRSVSPVVAALWRPSICREVLPPLAAGASASAAAVNGDGTIVGGSGAPSVPSTYAVPVRWRRVGDAWQVEQLDPRPGTVRGANAAGDLVGTVQVACATQTTCDHGVIWYAAGGARDLPTLGGEVTVPRAINALGEVVGASAVATGELTPFFWSVATGMRQLPAKQGGWAFGVSGARADGTRLVAGVAQSSVVWTLRP